MSSVSALSDAELHGLVDGCLAVERRADALRRAAASTIDRTRIGAWQDQNDLIRAAFADVALEPLPASLDLRTPPRLHCVARSVPSQPDVAASTFGRRGVAALLATAILVGGGLVGSWMLASEPSVSQPSSIPPSSSRASGEDDLDGLVAAALGPTEAGPTGSAMPTTSIPDLSSAGFAFLSADATAGRAGPMLFRYGNADADRLVVGAVRAGEAPHRSEAMGPLRIGRTYAWRAGDAEFAIAGTLPNARLRAIALSLSAKDRGR